MADEDAVDAVVTDAIETPAPDSPVDAQPEGDATEPVAEAPETPATTDQPTEAKPDKAERDWSRVTSALKNLQAENERLKADLASKPPAEPVTPSRQEDTDTADPLLNDLPYDEASDCYYHNGSWQDAAQVKLEQEVAALRQRLDANDRATNEARANAAYQKTLQGVQSEIINAVSGLREEFLPGLSTKTSQRADMHILGAVGQRIEQAGGFGKLSGEQLNQIITDEVQAEREYHGELATKQFQKNEETRQQTPIKPGGQPGKRAAVDPLSLSKREAEALADKAAAAAIAARSG